MSDVPDLAVFDQHDEPVLAAEVKSTPGTNQEWAASFHSNLASHRLARSASFFLLATPETFYFWVQKGRSQGLRQPDASFSSRHILEPYLKLLKDPSESLGESALEIIV